MKNKRRILFSLALFVFLVFFSINLISFVSAASCDPDWRCSSWSSCHDGEKERSCWDRNDCGTSFNKPDEVKSCHSSHDWDDCDRNDRDYCNDRNYCEWECDDNECHKCNEFGSSYMVAADQEYQDLLNFYNPQQTQTQPTPTYEIIVVDSDDSQRETNDFLSGNWNWSAIAIISISALILLIIIIIILLIARR